MNVDFAPSGATLRQFSSRWEGGLVRASGQWLRDGNQAVMDAPVGQRQIPQAKGQVAYRPLFPFQPRIGYFKAIDG